MTRQQSQYPNGLGITLTSLSKSCGYTPFGVQPCTVLSGK